MIPLIIFLFVADIVFMIASIWAVINRFPEGVFYIVATIAAFVGGCALVNEAKNPTPTKQDVIAGKAYYQETQIITGNDTIKTYDIVWKQEN